MQDDIMVSVIVLTYNHEKYIRQALDSILMQVVDFKYEVLVGDDCSTDGTREILLEYQEKYPDVLCVRLREKNIGATKNAYELHMNAIGKYVANLDGDDYWTNSNKLAMQVAFLEENPDFIGCSHKCSFITKEGKVILDYRLGWVKYKHIFSIDDFSGIYLPGQISTYVRRNLYNQGKKIDFSILYKTHSMISDRIAIMIFLLHGNFHCMDNYMSCYRISDKDNITSLVYKKNKQSVWDDCIITYAMENYIHKNGYSKEVDFKERKQYLFLKALYKMILYYEKGDIKLFKQYFCQNGDGIQYLKGLLPCGLKTIKDRWSRRK